MSVGKPYEAASNQSESSAPRKKRGRPSNPANNLPATSNVSRSQKPSTSVDSKFYAWEYTCHSCFSVTEEEEVDALLLCEGGCRRSFHLRCVGLSNFPGGNQKWTCRWCLRRLRACWLCSTYDGAGNLVKCNHPACAKSFHTECLKGMCMQNGKCPFHACGGCSGEIDEESVFCTKCPRAWHEKCVGRSALVLGDNFCLCDKHKWGSMFGHTETSMVSVASTVASSVASTVGSTVASSVK